jgi:hypothetical protein
MRIIVYTAIFGEYERTVKSPQIISPQVQYLCFTDSQPEHDPSKWTVRLKPRDCDDPRRSARRWKCLPHKLLPRHDFSIWIDANLQLKVDAHALIAALGDNDLASFKHPARRSETEEAEFVAGSPELDFPVTVLSQNKRHRESGFPDTLGLLETAIVVRRRNRRVARFNELWWDEICRGSRRDQISVMYCLWRARLRFGCLPGDGGRNNTPLALAMDHGH